MESSVSLSWCIRQGTRGEGDEDADYLPPLACLIRPTHLYSPVIGRKTQEEETTITNKQYAMHYTLNYHDYFNMNWSVRLRNSVYKAARNPLVGITFVVVPEQ